MLFHVVGDRDFPFGTGYFFCVSADTDVPPKSPKYVCSWGIKIEEEKTSRPLGHAKRGQLAI